jgi:mRNA interferase MazF
LDTVVVAPTSTRAEPADFRPEVIIGGRATRVLLEQIRATDRSRLGRSRGHLAAADLREIDEALGLFLGLI